MRVLVAACAVLLPSLLWSAEGEKLISCRAGQDVIPLRAAADQVATMIAGLPCDEKVWDFAKESGGWSQVLAYSVGRKGFIRTSSIRGNESLQEFDSLDLPDPSFAPPVQPTRIKWAADAPYSDQVIRQGVTWVGIKDRGIDVWTSIKTAEFYFGLAMNRFFEVAMTIQNHRAERLYVDASTTRLRLIKPKEMRLEKVSAGRVAVFLRPAEAQNLVNSELKTNTIFPGESVTAFTYFKGEKKQDEVAFEIQVGEKIYEFSFLVTK